jgi:glycerol kinase
MNIPIDKPVVTETTALGAGWLAGMEAGIYPDKDEFSKSWALERQFKPNMDASTRQTLCLGWENAVNRTLTNK